MITDLATKDRREQVRMIKDAIKAAERKATKATKKV